MTDTEARSFVRVWRYEIIGLLVFLLAACGLVATTVLLHRSDGAHRISMAMEDEAHAAIMRHDALSKALGSAVSDILFLRELNSVTAFLDDGSVTGSEALARELVAFAQTRNAYDQIRILSPEGLELVRVDRRDGSPHVVVESELQDKSDRGYFQEMLSARDSIYISRLDLNIENGVIERPLKPVLRFGVSLGEVENPRGYLVINMLGEALLAAYEAAHPNAFSDAYLLDSEGYWIRGPEREFEWGSILDARSTEGFQFAYPEEWRKFERERVEQFETNRGLLTFDIVVPGALARGFAADLGILQDPEEGVSTDSTSPAGAWLTVSVVSPETLRTMRSAGVGQLVGWNVVGLLMLGAGSAALAKRLRRRAEFLEHARQEKEAVASTLAKYMHKEIRDRLLADPSRHARLGGEAQDVVVLFADIRGFTRFTETNDPEYVVSVLNRTLTELTVPLRVFDGILDKYIGDGFLAFFEEKSGSDNAAQRAAEAARMMQKAFRNLWSEAMSGDLRELGLGIGVSAGRVVVGNIGSEGSMDYTVVGDAVNVASRLEGMAKSGEVLLCGAVRSRLQSDPSIELLHKAGRVRGRGKALDIYRLT